MQASQGLRRAGVVDPALALEHLDSFDVAQHGKRTRSGVEMFEFVAGHHQISTG